MWEEDDGSRLERQPLKAATEFGALILKIVEPELGKQPRGRPRKGTPKKEKAKRGLTITANTLRNWITGATVPLPEVLERFLEERRINGPAAIPILEAYGRVWTEAGLGRLQGVSDRVVSGPGGEAALDFEAPLRMITQGTSTTVAIQPKLCKLEELMRTGMRFGWITHAPTLDMFGQSAPWCALLETPFEKLKGLCLISDDFQDILEDKLANYGEFLVTLSPMVDNLKKQWRTEGQLEKLREARKFFKRVERYVTSEGTKSAVQQQILEARGRTVDYESQALYEVFDRYNFSARSGNWPDYVSSEHNWNPIRMYIRKHELLQPGEVARIVKYATPKPGAGAFEVVCDAENYDPVASRVMRGILEKLAKEKGWRI